MPATFQLQGQEFMALNGGPQFKFTEAISLFVKSQCGWLKISSDYRGKSVLRFWES
jgi:hypothetical protein